MSARRHKCLARTAGLTAGLTACLALCAVASLVPGKALGQTLSQTQAQTPSEMPGETPGGAAPLTRLEQVVSLSNAAARISLPVEIQGTVTYVRPRDSSLFLQDGANGLYVSFAQNIGLEPGDRVEVTGTTAASFRPIVMAEKVVKLGRGSLPEPVVASFNDLMHARLDCRYVTVSGLVLAAAYDDEQPHPALRLVVRMNGGVIKVVALHPEGLSRDAILGTEIRVSGTASGSFDSKMELAGVWVDVEWAKQLTVTREPKQSVWATPVTPIRMAGFGYSDDNLSERVHVAGTLTYFEPGALAVVQHGADSVLVETESRLPLHAGDAVEVTGFPHLDQETVRLVDGQLRAAPKPENGAAVQPRAINWDDASAGRYADDLVSMEGYVVAVVRDARVTMYVLRTGEHLFSATMRQSSSDAAIGRQEDVAVGSRVRVTGVCFVENGNHWRDRMWFDVRMRSPGDAELLELPSWWTFERLMWVIAGLGLVILAVVAWVALLGHRVRQQTLELEQKNREESASQRRFALYEQRRGEILEMISRGQSLGVTLDAIVGLVSYRLHGAHCWFDLDPRWEPESRTRVAGKMTIASEPMQGADGERLGDLHLSLAFHITDAAEMREALQAGARLAELAITTQRLYQDLRHRSEYDQLTEVPNRFSFERKVTELLGKVQRVGGSLALIYVDLDRFKDVNDQYGHHVGDLFLQQVAQRLKSQLRGDDMLARIGGDEFIVLLPGVRGRREAEDVVVRLERCFDEEFALNGYRLQGSASIGLAVAPDDGMDKEELQRVADMAMYLRKEQKKQENAGEQRATRTRLSESG